jgi:hypothetical protein
MKEVRGSNPLSSTAGQQRGAGAHHGVRRFGVALLLGVVAGLRLVGFVVVDPVSSVVPVSL